VSCPIVLKVLVSVSVFSPTVLLCSISAPVFALYFSLTDGIPLSLVPDAVVSLLSCRPAASKWVFFLRTLVLNVSVMVSGSS
jgi:hypothetical protein